MTDVDQWTCSETGCFRRAIAKGLCRSHYDKKRKDKSREAATALPADWQPPADLSPEWKQEAQRAKWRAQQEQSRARKHSQPRPDGSCGLAACGGTAMVGSDLCAAHDHWRAAQRRLAARGLA